MKPFKKITLPCLVRELTSFFVFRSDNPYLQASNTQSFKLSYCKLVLDDVFSKKPTANIKMLESTQDKTHSISSHQVLDKQYLDQLEKKSHDLGRIVIMCGNIFSIVSNQLQNSASFFDCVSVLENVVYNQACRLF